MGPPDTLVFSGGGPDGVAYVGCVRWLEDRGVLEGEKIRTVVGCSAGAIVALMVALRMTSREMEDWVRRGVASGDLTEVAVDGLLLLADRLGVDDGERIVGALRSLLRERGLLVPRAPGAGGEGGAEATDVTFLELAKATGRDLQVGAACLEDSRGVLLSVDSTPGLGVLKAVRMSISVPLLFAPVAHEGRTYVDGGLFDYCPTAHIERSRAATSTLAVRISVPPVPPRGPGVPLDFVSYALMLARAVMMRSAPPPGAAAAEASAPACGTTRVRSVDVPSLLFDGSGITFDARSMTLIVPAESIDRYVAHGYAAMEAALGPALMPDASRARAS